MDDGSVKTGIEVIGQVPWGTHFCQFYQTKQDLLDTLVPYFKAGLENNEFCMWITAEPLSAQEAHQAMRRAVPDFADRLKKGQIEILPHTEWYLMDGKFDQQRVLDGWVTKLNAGLAAGFAGLRLTVNTFWLEKPDWKSFTDYEAAVNDVIGRYQMLALCTYSLDKCGAAEVMDVIRNHEFALIFREGKWEIIENAIHKQAKQAVLESERKYRQLMESLQEGVWVINKDAITTFVNPRMAEMLGYNGDEMLGKPLFSFIDESNLSVAKERMERRRRGIREEVEFNFRRKDGSQLWALISAAPLTDVSGDFSGVIAGIVDITERKQMVEELWRSHGLMEAVTEGTGVIIAAQDTRHHYTYFNKAYQQEIKRLTGKDLQVGDSMIELFAELPEQQKVAVEELSQPLQGKTVSQRIEFGDPSRYRTVYRVFHTPIRDQNGNVVGAGEVAFDVSQQVRTEEALRQSEERYRGLYEAVAGGVVVQDKNGNIVDANAEARAILGLRLNEITGRTSMDPEWQATHEDGSPFLGEEHPSMVTLRTGETVQGVVMGVFNPTSGQRRWILINSEPLRDSKTGQTQAVMATFLDITQRKQIEESLRETRDYLDNLLNYANAPVIVWDPELRITKFNRAFQRLTGYREAEVVGQRLDMLFPKESREESLSHIHRAMEGERWETVEIPILRIDGEVRIVLWNSANIHTSDGVTTVATIAQGQDITERKRAEGDLRETRDYLDSLLNYANTPIIVWDRELRITKFNRAFQRLTGYQEAEVLGQRLDLLFPEESREESLAHIDRASAGQRWEVIEIPIRRADGLVRTVLWNSANIHASDGVTTVATIAQGQDITERKRAEEQLEFQANILSNLFDAVVAVDNDHRVTYWNRVAADLYGVPAKEAIGQRVEDLYQRVWPNPEDEQESANDLATTGHWSGENFHVKKNGERIYVRSTVSIIADEDGASAGMVSVIRDRTKLWQAEQEVKLLNEKLRQQAEERLRATDASFRRAITSSADGIVVVRKDGVIRFANPAAEGILGWEASKMVGTSFGFPLAERAEIEIPRESGSKTIAEMRIVELDWEGAPAYLATLRDITRRKEGLLALQESETRLRLLLDQIPCLTWTLDTKLRFTSFTGSGSEVFEDVPDQILGMTLAEYFKVDELDFTPYMAHRQALQGTPADFELSWAGRTFYGRVESLGDADDHIVGVVGVAFDITERKQAEEQLRNLSNRLVTAQENERRRIARELHDEVGQSLTALKLSLDRASPGRSTGDGSDLAEAREALRELMARVRSMSLELRPTMLDDLGLLPTLLWHFKRYTAQTNVEVHFKHRGLRRDLPQDTVTAAYRLVQEALTNVARHAQVNEVQVCVRAEYDALVVEVEDHGTGFDLDSVASTKMGLNGMRERALSLQGKLLVQSKPGEGTCVIAELPLAKRRRSTNKEQRKR